MLVFVTCQPIGIRRRRTEPVTKTRDLKIRFLNGLAMLPAEQPCPLLDIILPSFKIIRDRIQF
ncbi:MAG: Uncharacterised protein [SAR116 cluster bacterium]|nr:MAG: Uncharacterised protein [SAR116 cluster bacterium]